MEDSSSASGREESPIPTNTFAAAEEQVKSRAMSSSDDGPLPQIKAVVNDTGGFIPTDNPQVLCTPLPLHCRVNSPIHIPFIVVTTLPVPDGTLVRLSANNKFNPVADLKNAEALMTNQMAKFPDIRFVGRSGRGEHKRPRGVSSCLLPSAAARQVANFGLLDVCKVAALCRHKWCSVPNNKK